MGSVLHVTLPMQHGSQWDDTYVLQTPTDMGVANDVRTVFHTLPRPVLPRPRD